MATEKRPSELGTHSHHHSPEQDEKKDNQHKRDPHVEVGKQ